MSGVWNRTLVYLGLREEPEQAYDELPERFVPDDDPHAEHAPPRKAAQPKAKDDVVVPPTGTVSSAAVAPDVATQRDNVLSLRSGDPHVRAVSDAPSARAAVVDLAAFDDVEMVGARYRTGQAVLFDLGAADATTARRIVDFVSGLTYASRGELAKVGARAFLIVPNGIILSSDERRRLNALGYELPIGSDA